MALKRFCPPRELDDLGVGREAERQVRRLVIDSQSLKTTESGGIRGYGAGKRLGAKAPYNRRCAWPDDRSDGAPSAAPVLMLTSSDISFLAAKSIICKRPVSQFSSGAKLAQVMSQMIHL